MLKVGIIGSCVTRDAFEVTNNVYDVKGAYFPRASLISRGRAISDVNKY